MSYDPKEEELYKQGREDSEAYYKPHVKQLEATIGLLQARLRVEGEKEVTKQV